MGEHLSARAPRHLSDSLISAAESCLTGRSHLDVTVREIAASAGTYAGMVNYYFSNKDGLLSALIEGVVADVDRQLKNIEAAIAAGAPDPTRIIVSGLVEAYLPYPVEISIMFTEVFRQDSEIKKQYAKHGGSHAFDRIERLLKRLVDTGQYRADLDTASATWMIVSLIISPHLLQPMGRAMGASTQLPQIERWIDEVAGMVRKHAAVEA